MQPRDGNGMYRFEMAWETKESGVIHEMVQPRLLINNESHPMSRTAMTTNRWETLVSIPKEETFVNYRYVVNYAKKGGKLQPSLNSIASKPYELQIIETNRVPIRTYK